METFQFLFWRTGAVKQTHTQLNTVDLSQATISHKRPGETTPQYDGIHGQA